MRDGADNVCVADLYGMVAVVPAVMHLALKADIDGAFLSVGQPNLAAGQPEIGKLRLPAVHKFLFENAVLVKDGVAAGGVAAGGQTVQITSGKPSQTAVAEARVRFTVVEFFQIDAVFLQHLFEHACQIQVIQVVF